MTRARETRRPTAIDASRRSTTTRRGDAEKALAEALTRLDQGNYVEPTKQTLAAFLDDWLAAVRPRLRPSTFATYETLIERHLKPRLGSLPLQNLTAARLNALYAHLLSSGRKDGKGGLAPASVRYLHAVIRKALSTRCGGTSSCATWRTQQTRPASRAHR